MTNLESIMLESVRYRMIRDLFRLDPDFGPSTVQTLQQVFEMAGESRKPSGKRENRAD